MKRHILYFLSFALVLSSVLVSSIYQPSKVEAASGGGIPPAIANAAQAYCSSVYGGPNSPGEVHYTACFDGYVREAAAGESQSKACTSVGPAANYQSFCIVGWQAAKNNTTPGSGQSVLEQEISQLCLTSNGQSYYNSCKQGVTGESQGKSESDSCQGSSDSNACNIGWTSEQTRKNPDQVSAAAQTACAADKSDSSLYSACIIGQESGAAGDTTNAVCNSFSGKAKTACQDSWTQASSPQQQQTGATTPTCEASGFSAAWVLCPIFNLVSDGSRFIFQSIVQPFLVTQPINANPSDPTYQIWSNFRIYGDIFLVITLLIVVFGESIGGGLIDAYTAKKILPRLLTAAILINLSIYIVAGLVDITNILGKGISGILTAPLTQCTAGSGNCWDFSLSNTDIVSVFGVGLVGFLATSAAVAGLLGSILFGGAIAVSAAFTAAFFIAIPMLFAILGVFLTLIFRKGLILFLVLVSPVAFCLYVLPNTEKYFRKWWDLLLEALMIYPIIVAIFGVADILSITLLQANSIAPSSFTGHVSFDIGRTLALVAAFMLQFLPLFAIPFAFRFASGALGRIYGAATTAGGVVHKAATGRREQAKQDYSAQSLAARARMYQGARGFGERHKGPLGIGRAASRWAGARAGGYNIESLMSAQRAVVGKQLNDQIATGRDEEIRGLTVNKTWALNHGALTKENGFNNGQVRRNDNGELEFKSLGGAWVKEQDVDAGHSRWGNNQFAQQAALAYEMRKASSEEDLQNVARNYGNVATGAGGWGMSNDEAKGAFTGAAFEHQNQHLEFKYTDALTGQLSNANGFVDEIYEKKGSYPMAQMSSNTIENLKQAYTQAVAKGDLDQQGKIAAIAQTFMHEAGTGGIAGMTGEDDKQQPIRGDAASVARRVASTPGAAHVAERVRELAVMTGVYDEAPAGQYVQRDHAPTPNGREQV